MLSGAEIFKSASVLRSTVRVQSHRYSRAAASESASPLTRQAV